VNKYIIQLGDLPWSRVFIGGLVALALMYFLVYDDGSKLTAAYQASKNKAVDAERVLRQTQKAMEDADRFEKEVLDLGKQFERIYEYMPEKLNSADLETIVSEQVKNSNVTLIQMTPNRTEQKFGFYETAKIDFDLEGSFAQIVTFLSFVSRVPRLLTFDSMDLRFDHSVGEQSRLKFRATMTGYRYLKNDAAAKPKGVPNAK
jgi:Tfp pilus assembly protein PilO